MYDLRIAESITKSGQLAIIWVGRKVNEALNKALGTDVDYVVYTDTDSIYVSLEAIVDHYNYSDRDTSDIVDMLDQFCEAKMQPIIDNGYEELAQYCNSYSQKMIMAREVISDNSVFCAKKRYAMSTLDSEGVRFDVNKPYIKTMGLDVVKSSTPMVVRSAMKNTIEKILNQNEEDVQDYIKEFKKEFKEQEPEDIAFPRGVNKLEESYCDANGNFLQGKTIPINSRAAMLFNRGIKESKLDVKKPNGFYKYVPHTG